MVRDKLKTLCGLKSQALKMICSLPGLCQTGRKQVLSKRKGMIILLLFVAYKKQYPNGYSIHTVIQVRYQCPLRVQPVMHLEHKAGDKRCIDFAGENLSLF